MKKLISYPWSSKSFIDVCLYVINQSCTPPPSRIQARHEVTSVDIQRGNSCRRCYRKGKCPCQYGRSDLSGLPPFSWTWTLVISAAMVTPRAKKRLNETINATLLDIVILVLPLMIPQAILMTVKHCRNHIWFGFMLDSRSHYRKTKWISLIGISLLKS